MFPYDHPADEIASRAQNSGLDIVLFNLPAGDWEAGERGLGALPDRIPEMRETITIGGTFLSSDGVPVGRAMINFTASETDQNIKRSAFTRTDENGRFSVQILKDSEGELSGTARLEEAQFISCPQIFRLIGGEPESGWRKVKSNILKISAGKNIENTELNLSFPSCNKQPLISRSRID